MNFKTRLSRIFELASFQLIRLFKVKEKNFTIALFFLFSGFLIGNLFGTFLALIRQVVQWDGLILAVLIALLETISYFRYSKKFFIRSRVNDNFKTNVFLLNENWLIWKNLNYLKIGVLLGFFIDAFKVGS